MKRGLILLVIFALMLPFAMAGQVSDFFKYFTNDAFSLITGNQIIGFNNGQLTPKVPEPIVQAKKASGAECKTSTECLSLVCTKLGTKAVCGKKPATLCKDNSECYSGICTLTSGAKRCTTSPLGKPCLNNAECAKGLTCVSNVCTSAQAKPAITTPGIIVQGAKVPEKPAIKAPPGIIIPQAKPAEKAPVVPVKNMEAKELEKKIQDKVTELNSRANRLLGIANNAQAKPAQRNTPADIAPGPAPAQVETVSKFSVSAFFKSIFPTGNLILQIPGFSSTLLKEPVSLLGIGLKCNSNSQCLSKYCYQIGIKGLCGKKYSLSCSSSAECLSGKCSLNKCAKSGLGVSCLQNADCASASCNQNTNKCQLATQDPIVFKETQVLEISKEPEPAIKAPTGIIIPQAKSAEEQKITTPGIIIPQAKPAEEPKLINLLSEDTSQEKKQEEQKLVNLLSEDTSQEKKQEEQKLVNLLSEDTSQEKINCDAAAKKKLQYTNNQLRELKKRVCTSTSQYNNINYGNVKCTASDIIQGLAKKVEA